MKNILITIILLLSSFSSMISNEWIFKVSPKQIVMESSYVNQTPYWFSKNHGIDIFMCNLSFFTSRTFVGPYKDSRVNSDKNSKRWPVLYLSDSQSVILPWNIKPAISYNYMASGFPLLINNKEKLRVSKTYFSRRNCPRTAIGILESGELIIYITKNSTISSLQNRMYELGCVSALNFDGGGSTFIFKGGKEIYPKKVARRYPNVLIWKEKNN